ncbi:tetratricopeptide repeat protein [Spongiactinospora sp. TRM90649]|uniref:AfsR/SARP family transcriptional regulator n=1 Tax=Spongiactinospora sp. TRM90649 TaxID=3031114 RepID=UPI0023F79F7C|nr:tetratricopeptide repeat protein [Spongiactinospora sp. TRM90649]MDF5754539.1 tetratricopeptide repeat protein [Spongiactinospora sp. TRM90649]
MELWADGEMCDLGSAKARHVLAVLLSAPGQPVSIATVIDRVWGENPPPKARGSVHAYIARLRRLLGDRAPLDRRSGTYVLDVDPDCIDLYRSRQLETQARAIADSGNPEDALRLLIEAENLWRGEPLAGLSGEWARNLRISLESERHALIRKRVEIELEVGHHAELISYLYRLVGEHPWDESFVEHLMVALYRCGRQTEALKIYHEARQRLSEDHGTDPTPALSGTYQRILNADRDLASPRHRRRPRRVPPANTLPRDTPDFTGREAELRHLFSALDRPATAIAIAAIDGMPGIGKTALATHAAHQLADRYPDGRLFLQLFAHDPTRPPVDPADGLETLLSQLGVAADRMPDALEPRAALWRARLADRRMIVVLDDAAGADQVRPFLPAEPGCLVLITSRYRLTGLAGIRPLSLDALSSQEAALLFRRIVGTERSLESDDVSRLVRLCGRLPLAVTIMATRLRHRPARGVGDLVTKLTRARNRLSEIRAGGNDLVTAFELSYRGLTPAQQRAFRRLGLHVGADVTADAATALIECELPEAEQALEELIDRHLVQEPHADRVRFHDLLRMYARERAEEEEPPGEPRRAVARLLDYYLRAADEADRTRYPHRRRAPLVVEHPPAHLPVVDEPEIAADWLRAEHANLMSCAQHAADQGFPGHAVQLSLILATHLERGALWLDAKRLHETALRICQETGDRERAARVTLELSLVESRTGHLSDALQHALDGLHTFRELGEERGEAEMLDQLARACWLSGRLTVALEYAEQAVSIFRALRDHHGEGTALLHKGIALSYLGRPEEAEVSFKASLRILRGTDDRAGMAQALNNLGDIEFNRGNDHAAMPLYHGALDAMRSVGWRQFEAVALNNVAGVLQRRGRHNEALHFYREALAVHREIGDKRHEAEALCNIGRTYLVSDMNAEAMAYFQKALAVARNIGDLYQQTRALQSIGDSQRTAAEFSLAHETYEQALSVAREVADPYLEAGCLQGLGEVLLHIDDREAAEARWRQAIMIFDRLGAPEAAALRVRLRDLRPPSA